MNDGDQSIYCVLRKKYITKHNSFAYYALMELSTLKLFVQVMRLRSFTEVAKSENIAPSSVSRAIAGLETELGTRLFQRSTRRLEPTEAGLNYFDRIVSPVDELESASQLASDNSEQPVGTIRVTVPTVFGLKHVVPLIPGLQQSHPGLSIELMLIDTYQDLIGERIDVAIRLGALRDSGYVVTRLTFHEVLYLCEPGLH